MRIQINITKKILKKSMYCEQEPDKNCAIAKAIIDLFPTALVESAEIYFPSKGIIETSIPLPFSAISFIQKFDNSSPEERLKLKPFSFEIDVPEEIINEIGIDEVYKILEKTPSLELVK